MSLKFKRLLIIYTAAAVITLGLYAWVSTGYLGRLRLMSGNVYGADFDAGYYAVENMAEALKKSAYAADEAMCAKVCAEIYANALTAEASLSNLPFATQELEELQSFLNTAGDYAYSACGTESFSDENVEMLLKMSEAAEDYKAALVKMRGDMASGALTMDSREERLRNFPDEDETRYLSAEVLRYEHGFEGLGDVSYDGQYGFEDEEIKTDMPESEMKKLAAEYLDRPELSFEYKNGQRCYTDGEKSVIVGETGVISMWSSRLVPESAVSEENALNAARKFLEEKEFSGLEVEKSESDGNVTIFTFASESDGTARLNAEIKVGIAQDDGSVYSFNAVDYSEEDGELSWRISEEQAKNALPRGKTADSVRKTVIKSPGGNATACYELSVEGARVYVSAETGKQVKIEIE